MKKAQEYAREFVDALKAEPEMEILTAAILTIVEGLAAEMDELMRIRKARSADAHAAIIKEQDRKWRAIARRVNEELDFDVLSAEGFMQMVNQIEPLVTVLKLASAQREWRGFTRNHNNPLR